MSVNKSAHAVFLPCGLHFDSILAILAKKNQSITQKTEKVEKTEVKKAKTTKAGKEKSYDLPEIPDYERPVLEKPREFDFGEHVPREKTKLDRPVTQVRDVFRCNLCKLYLYNGFSIVISVIYLSY